MLRPTPKPPSDLEEVANEIRTATGVKVVAVQADMSVQPEPPIAAPPSR